MGVEATASGQTYTLPCRTAPVHPITPPFMKDFYEKQIQADSRRIEKIERLRERAEDRKDRKSLRAFEKEADKELFGKDSDF